MKLWRLSILLSPQKSVEGRLAFGAPRQHEKHAIERQIAGGGTPIELATRQRMGIPYQRLKIVLVDLLDYPLARCLRRADKAKRQRQQQGS